MTSDIFCSNSFVMKCLKRLINDNFPVFSFIFGSSHSVCYCPAVKLCLTLCNSRDCSTPGLLSFTISWHLLKFMFTESVMLSHPLLPPSPLAFNFPSIRVFSDESALHIRWPKYWSFSFSIRLFNEYSGLVFL